MNKESESGNFVECLEKLINSSFYNKACILLGTLMIYFAAVRFEEERYFNCVVNAVVASIVIVNNSVRLYKNRHNN